MNETEKDFRKAFEEVTTRNVQASIAYGNETRKLLRDMEAKMSQYDSQVKIQDGIILQLNSQISGMQSILYRGGTS